MNVTEAPSTKVRRFSVVMLMNLSGQHKFKFMLIKVDIVTTDNEGIASTC